MMRWLITICLFSITSQVMAQEQALQSTQPIAAEVWLPVCQDSLWDRNALIQTLRVELAEDGVSVLHVRNEVSEFELDTSTNIVAALRIALPCNLKPPTARIEVQDAATHQWVGRAVSLQNTHKSAVPRTLALALVELLHARWAELLQRDIPGLDRALPQLLRERVKQFAPAPKPQSEPRAEQPVPAEPSTPWVLGGWFEGRWYSGIGNVVPVLGGLLRYGIVEGGLSVSLGEVNDDLGDRLWALGQLRLGVWFLEWGSPAWLALGVHGETALGWTEKGPDNGNQTLQSGLGLYSNVMLDVRSSWELAPKWIVFGQLSGGYSGNPVCFDDHCALTSGALLSLSAGIATEL